MSTDPVATYQEALHNYDVATRQMEQVLLVVNDAANKLLNWKRVFMTNIKLTFPAEVIASGISINADEWPTAQQVGEALANWHQANQAVQATWRKIPQERRRGLQPPS